MLTNTVAASLLLSSLPAVQPTGAATGVTLRPGAPADAEAAGTICYVAFAGIANQHGFPPDFPSPESGIGLLTMLLGHPGFYSVVAERDGVVVGSNFLDERSPIAGVGPITIDPTSQNSGVGRLLMRDVLERANQRGFAGVRLLQGAYHSRSLSLYASLGFQARELIACMQGPALGITIPGYDVRPATLADFDACNQVAFKVHGHDRGGELLDAIALGTARVVEHDGRITGYTTGTAYFGHSVGETTEEIKALIGAASAFDGPGILVPVRNSALFQWALENRLRVEFTLTLMSVGLYNEPAGGFLPSILY